MTPTSRPWRVKNVKRVVVSVFAIAIVATGCSSESYGDTVVTSPKPQTQAQPQTQTQRSTTSVHGATTNSTSTTSPPTTSTVVTTSTQPLKPYALDEQWAYESCKTVWMREQGFIDRLSVIYPYQNLHKQLLSTRSAWMVALDQMRRAAELNDKWNPYVVDIDQSLGTAEAKLGRFVSGKEMGTFVDEWQPLFSQLCTEFGIWSSTPGKYPPLKYSYSPIDPSPLTAARGICLDLFYESRDFNMYHGDLSISLDDCDEMAKQSAGQSATQKEARKRLFFELFSEVEYWCWGSSCFSEIDLRNWQDR